MGSGTPGSADAADPSSQRYSFWRRLWRLVRRVRSRRPSIGEAIDEMIERQAGDNVEPFSAAERTLLENILRLRGVTVDDVMVPRADIIAVEAETPLADVIAIMHRTHHSRLPVYRRHLDDVVGMVHVKDVFPLAARHDPPPLETIVRSVLFVVPSMRVLDLLLQMRSARTHLAMVVDEFGGIDGLVTIENLVEEIVGEIQDEHDHIVDPEMTERSDGTIVADARVTVEDFEERVGPVLSEEERENVHTLGGLVFTIVGRVPNRGELVRHDSGLEFEVLDGDPRRLKRLRIRNIAAVQMDAEEDRE